MRYEKGTVHLNPVKDIPLLCQVFHSVYSTRHQLFAFMQLHGCEQALGAFRMRLTRLVKHDLVQRVSGAGVSHSLYTIGRPGVDVLVDRGVSYAGRGCGMDRPLRNASHALQLNEMHLTLLRSGLLREWIPEAEIYSRNILTNRGFAKDYDAVIAIAGDQQAPLLFGLEYERSQKTDGEYHEIAISLNREAQAEFVLYAAATSHLFSKLSAVFRQCRQTVAICLASDFVAHGLDGKVMLANEQWRMTVRELVELKRGLKAAPAQRPA